uniref:Uncharacterized protein n=1 Tax=Kalanchoe fedtschenkoi TaxID=63787 RepID=A0A7N0TBI6_KALFE
MAAAEARAAWQRSANRYFVQEDAKRAPKLACCQPSSLSKLVDTEQANPADVFPAVGFMPANRSPSSANLPPDLRWWLQTQPNYCHQRGLTHEQLSGSEFEAEFFRSGGVHSCDMSTIVEPVNNESNLKGSINSEYSKDMTYTSVPKTSVKKELEVEKQELKTMYCEKSPELSEMSSYYEVLGVDSDGSSAGKQKTEELGLDYEAPWIGTQKAEPWWRTADGDELASLVLQKSLDTVDNCDLPPPQNTSLGWNTTGQFGYFSSNRLVASSLTKKRARDGLTDLSVPMQKNLGLATSYSVQRASNEHSELSSNSGSSNGTAHDGIQDTLPQVLPADATKAQLLEALCHSQTRAREAEKAVKQASIEKEHIMKLFFRQASHLFAYKQWFKLLHLEAFYSQLKNKDQPLSSLFPPAVPWTPQKARKLKRSLQKRLGGKGSKPGRSRFSLCRYGLAVALGLGLVGAGLLIGWTVGWLFPAV